MNKCNSFDGYEKARKKIEEANKNIRYCYIQGPTGPAGEKGEQGIRGEKGEKGPATIKIGKVETIDSESSADVLNVGTSDDVILDFKIPRGVKGEKGEKGDQGLIGPRGLPGEIGRTEHISIDETETLESGEEAQVMDTFENLVHHLSFFIPKGDMGPIGPTGPKGDSLNPAYGIIYSTSTEPMQLTGSVDTAIPLGDTGVAFNTDYTVLNAIKIKEGGIFLISYLFSASANEECTITVSVKDNDLLLPATNTNVELSAHIIDGLSGSTIAALEENDVITLNVRASTNVNLTFNEGTSAMLSVLRIH